MERALQSRARARSGDDRRVVARDDDDFHDNEPIRPAPAPTRTPSTTATTAISIASTIERACSHGHDDHACSHGHEATTTSPANYLQQHGEVVLRDREARLGGLPVVVSRGDVVALYADADAARLARAELAQRDRVARLGLSPQRLLGAVDHLDGSDDGDDKKREKTTTQS